GVAKNGPRAVYWFERAAEHRYAGAAYNLAVMYRDGDGVAADAAKAAEWFRKAKRLGYDGDTDDQPEDPSGGQTIPI
ncbi:tetratricopeptide repeat protein, partial [Rhizobium sp. LEGMi12c]